MVLAGAVGVLTDKRVTSTAAVAGAEAALRELEEHDVDGLVAALVDVVSNHAGSTLPSARRLCLTLLKQVLKRQWGGRALSEGVRGGVREALPHLLADGDGRVRALAAAALAQVAVEDWPEAWPGFVDALLACLTAPLGEDGSGGAEALTAAWLRADGALRCLADFMGDLDGRLVPRLTAATLPVLLQVAGMAATEAATALVASAFGVGLRTACLRVVHATLEALVASDDQGAEVAAEAGAVLDAQFGPCLAAAASCLADAGWGSRLCSQKLAAMRVIATGAQYFPSRIKPLLPDVVAGVAGVLAGCLTAFRDLEVDAEDTDAAVACTDGVTPGPLDAMADEQDDCTPASVSIQALLFLQSCLLSPKRYMQKAFGDYVPHLGYLLASLAQLTEGQLSEWGNDVRAFALNETEEEGDRGVDLRHEVVQTAGDLVGTFGRAGLTAVLDAALAALTAGITPPPASPFAAFSTHRWKAVEAGLYLVGALRKYVVNPDRAGKVKKGTAAAAAPPLPFHVPTMLDQVMSLVATGGDGAFTAEEPAAIRAVCAPYVVGRAMWTASRVCGAEGVTAAQREGVLAACVAHLVPEQPAAERVLACRALHAVSPRVGTAAMEAAAPEILRRLTALIVRAIEASAAGGSGGSVLDADTAALEHIELLVTTARYATSAAAADAGPITDLLLHLWVRKGTHPLLAHPIVLGLRVMLTATALAEPAAAACVMTAQVAVITSVMRALLVAIHNESVAEGEEVPLPPLATPGGGELPLDDDVRDVELGVMAAAGCGLLEDILRRLRALQMPAGASADVYYTPPTELSTMLALVAQLVRTTDDHKVMVAGAQLLTVAVRLIGQHLPPTSDGTTLALDGVCATAGRLLTDAEAVEDEVAAAAAPLVAALVSHTSTPATFIPLVLPALLTRLAVARMPSFVTRLAHVVGHCLLHDAAVTLPLLTATVVPLPATGPLSLAAAATSVAESAVLATSAAAAVAAGAGPSQPGHILFLRAAATMLPWSPAALSRGIILTAVMHLLSQPDILASAAAVAATGHRETAASEAAAAAAGRRTRSKGSVEYVAVSLPARLLKLLITEWAAAVEDDEEEADDADTDGTSDGEDSDAGDGAAAGGAGGGAAGGAAASHKPRANPFMPAEALEELMGPAMEAAAEAEAKRAAKRAGRRGGKKRDADVEDALDLAYLSDLLAGGDALGNGNTVAAMLAAGNTFHGGDDDDDSADGDGVVDDLAGVARADALDGVAAWDEVPEPGVEGVTVVPLPHDPVVATFLSIDAETHEVSEELPIAALQAFLQRVAGDAARQPDSLVGHLVAATVPELAPGEMELLNTRLGHS